MIRVYYYDIGEITEDGAVYRALYEAAAECRKRKAAGYRFFRDRCLCLAAGELLSRALGEFGSPLSEDDALYGENGKPYFKDGGIFFNLSHSGHLAACVMSDEGPAGIDVEEISGARMEVARRFFSAGENDALLSAKSDSERDALFTRLWTLKESFLKAKGTGLADDLSSIDFSHYIGSLPGFAAEFGGFSCRFETLEKSGCAVSVCTFG